MKTSLRKVIFFLLILSVSILVFMPFAFADDSDVIDSGNEGNLSWSIDAGGQLTVWGSGAIPDCDYSGGHTPDWIAYRGDITSVEILPGVTGIGSGAFYQCQGLVSCILPEGLVSIGSEAFKLCAELSEISIPSSVTDIGAEAFSGCSALRNVLFSGNAPFFGTNCFKGVSATMFPSCLSSGWDASTMLNHGGSLIWELHDYAPAIVTKEPTCTDDGKEVSECRRCGKKETTVIPSPGHSTQHFKAKDATCTEDGNVEYWHCSVCGNDYSDSACLYSLKPEKIIKTRLGHKTVVDEGVPATADTPGLTKGEHCGRCGEILKEQKEIPALGYDLIFEGLPDMTAVDIGGTTYYLDMDGKVNLPYPPSGFAAAYTFNTSLTTVPHLRYPTGMKVYAVTENGDGSYRAEPLPFLDKTAVYGGCSIRCRGVAGLRAVFSLPEQDMYSLTGSGIDGYRLVEYGMLGAFGNREDLSIEDSGIIVGTTFVIFENDRPILTEAGRVFYAAEFLGFTKAQWKKDFTVRVYMIYETPWGTDVLYGPPVTRSMGYVAQLNADTYPYGSAEYRYIHSIIETTRGR